jgi:uncharacterized protein (TIGR02996 family)
MHEAFLADIAAKADDGPRLVYADWLDENGDRERAAFIRAQCRLAGMGPCDPERFGLEADAEALLERHGKKWLKPVPKVGARIEFARGFPHRFTLPVPKLLEHGDALLAAAPTLCEYHPLKYATGWEAFVKSPLLGRLSGLELGDFSITGGRAAALLSSPRVGNLKSLSIGGAKLGVGGAEALTGTAHLGGLRRLALGHSTDGDRILTRLVASPHFPGLVSLELRENGLGPAGVAALARSPLARRLESLTLEEEAGGDDEARAFAAGRWRSLRKLSLSLEQATADGISALAAVPSLSGLRELELTHGRGQSLSHAALFTSGHLTRLERLVLHSRLAPGSLEALAASPMLAHLRGLVIVEGGKASAAGMAAVLGSPASAGLVELEFDDTDGIAAVARSFARATHLTALRRLSLGYSWNQTPHWACDVLRAPHLGGVVRFDFGNTYLHEVALRALIASPNLGGLRRLWIAYYTFYLNPKMRKPVEERFGPVVKIW